MSQANEEDNLISKAILGDVDAYGDLYLLHVNSIFRYVYFRVGERQDAEDITEQVFLKAWEALPRFTHKGLGLSGWLYRIAHNEVVDHHRKNKLTLQAISETVVCGETAQETVLDFLINRSDIEKMRRLIPLLTDDQQQIIMLRFSEGLSHEEISKITGKKAGTCRMIQHRALQSLSSLLKVHFPEDS